MRWALYRPARQEAVEDYSEVRRRINDDPVVTQRMKDRGGPLWFSRQP